MKNLKFLPLAMFVFSSLVLTSCKKDIEDKLPGDAWTAAITYSADGLSFAGTGTMTFKEDGTGTSSTTFLGETDTDTFTWTSVGEESITITSTEDLVPVAMTYTVTTNEKDEQVWTMSITEDETTVKIDVKLTR